MSSLALYLLGPPRLERDGEPVQVKRRKVMALLAYLAVAGQGPVSHSRESLVTLLSPELDQSRARNELRRTLSVLNRLLGAGCLIVDHDTVSLDPSAELWLDVAQLRRTLATCEAHDHPPDTSCPDCVPHLEEAVALYRDDFLDGFTLPDSLEFEEWQFFQAEGLRNQMASALQRLVTWHDAQNEYEPAIAHTRRWLELDPTQEPVHRLLMRLYGLAGQRGAALRQFRACLRVLEQELGVEPTPETTALYHQIRSGELTIAASQPLRGYELRERIGAGGFGEVFRGYQPSVGREVAIKIILPQFAHQPEFVRRFESEAQLVARLEHPHIVPLYDYWRDPQANRAYLVMRWLRGGNLGQALQDGPWSPHDAAHLLEQIASALHAAHQQGVVHRDVKPENILLDQERNAYLSDFGIAKDLQHGAHTTEAGSLRGSLAYIAPEQAQGQPVTPRSDIYSLGMVLYETLTGDHPYADLTPADQLVRRLTEPLPPLRQRRPDLPRALEAVIERATALDPVDRYPDALAFAQAFRAALAVPPAPDRAPPEPQLPRPVPAFLDLAAQRVAVPQLVFVAREAQLQRLEAFLAGSLDGQGQVAFITGDPGSGKTALMNAFAQRAMDAHPDLLVARGNCNAYSGLGDPYLPFRDVLGMLTGDVEPRWSAGAITRTHAQRLWSALPLAARALLEHGAPLIDTLVPADALFSRAVAAAPADADWLRQLRALAEGAPSTWQEPKQNKLFDACTDVLRSISARHPLLLLLDDLQWADSGSISLLFHLGRRFADLGGQVLILGAYRPEEVAQGRGDERHPLQKMLTEFKRSFGDVWVDLSVTDESAGRRFVEALLDTEPNLLGDEFRRALSQHTRGHPLFTVELLRAMQERGDLVQDAQGRWIGGRTLDWETLPPRVEAVIEERVGPLEERLRDILTLASVEGETFTAQVVSRLGNISERELLRALSQELGARHHLVQEGGEVRLEGAGRFLTRYQFRHVLFQRYLYNALSAGERRLLHGEVGEALEELHHGNEEQITAQLAHHYAQAANAEKAVGYLLRAGDHARGLYAHADAIDHYRQALAFLKASGQDAHAARTLMRLGLAYHNAFEYHRARQAYDEGFALWRRSGEGAPTTSMPPTSHTLKLYTYEPRTLDPTLASAHRSIAIINQLFSGLVELTPEMEILPAAAQTWEISADGCQYLFRLRNDVYWSDGVPVTAGDFEYAWKRALDPRTGAALASLLYDIKGARAFHEREIRDPDSIGVRALDAITLQVELEGPTGYYLQLLDSCITYPVPRHVVDLHGPAWTEVGNIVTNGPFKLDAWQPGESMVLSRDSAYRGRFTGNLGQVVLSFPAALNTSTGLRLYEANNLSILELLDLSASELSHARQRHPAEHVSVPTLNTLYVGFDVTRPPFDDQRVRRAFVLASDRERLAHDAWGGCFPATGGLVPPGMPGHSAGVGLSYNPEQAQQLLAEAGFPDGRGFPEVEALWPDIVQSQGDWLQAHWRAGLGVAIEWQAVDWATYIERLDNAPPPVFFGAWRADYPDPDNFLRASLFRPRTRWHNATYQRLVEEARRIQDQAKRMSLYRQADAILIEEAPIIPLVYRRHDVLVKPWVRQFPVSPMSWWFWKDVIIEPH